MKRWFIYIILCIMCVGSVNARTWETDILGDKYEMTSIVMPDDYSGPVIATVVRRLCEDSVDKAVLYIHGYNDYFFQKELGNEFNVHGYNFYAVDLRKYGRSILEKQQLFEARDLREYFADIDSALSIIKEDGNKDVVLMGHSTGGLISSYYMVNGGENKSDVDALILNSPFMDMNLSKVLEEYVLSVVVAISEYFPRISITQGSNDAYAQSLLKQYHGEWEYNTEWKLPLSPAITSGWLGAIDNAQNELQKGVNIGVPILLMRSSKSVYGGAWSPEFNNGDSVLDVNEISCYGRKLGDNVKELVVKDGLHDIILSRKEVRAATYDYIFNWLKGNQ